MKNKSKISKSVKKRKPFIVKEIFRSAHYEIKYLTLKNRTKKILYQAFISKTDLENNVKSLEETVKHQKEIIKGLREDNRKLRGE